ncbi:MAG TPA: Ig-like domain-containing protein [Gemmataceae bacterium]|nr:Ig-like domain-containing protein [Gemmataceae bacterium]
MWFRPSLPARPKTIRHVSGFSRRLLLERLEDRLVPSHSQVTSLTPSIVGVISITGLQTKASTSIALLSSANPSVFGQSVTFTATISNQGLTHSTPTGTVQFQIDGTNAGSPVNVQTTGGVTTASLSVSALAAGTHTVTAGYSGDTGFATSTGRLTGGQLINPAVTMTAVSSSAESSVFGQNVTFTATISVMVPGNGSPTGTVQFVIDGSAFGNPVNVGSSGGTSTASISTASLGVGVHTVKARYSGDGNFANSSADLTGGQIVDYVATTTAVSSSLNSPVFGQSVTFTATISVVAPGAGTPTGTVQFQIDGSNAGRPVTVSTSGGVTAASLSIATLSVGSHTISASYSGDGDVAPSTGGLAGGQAITKAGSSTAVSSAMSPSVTGQSVTLTATISVTAPGAGTPTGTVQFQIDGANVGSPVSVGTASGLTTASFSIATLMVGTHTIKANYNGDGSFAGSSGTLSGGQVVNKASTSTAVTSSGSLSVFGQSATFTATISVLTPGAGTPTGMVQFQIDGNNAGSPVSVTTAAGLTTASFSITTLAVGTHTITASYTGDGSFASSLGTSTNGQTVNKANTSTAVSSSASSSVFGQPVTFIATISILPPGAGTPTGTVQFQIDGNNVGSPVSVSATGGVTTASLTTATLAVGTHTITANYNGDGSFTGSRGTSSNGQTVNKASTSTAVSTSANPAVFGQSVAFTATLTANAPGSGVPSGTVQFQIDGNNLGSPVTLSGGQATSFTISSLAVNGHSIKVVYSGDTSFAASSGTMTQTVTQAATRTSVTSSVNASVFGQSVTFTATISVQSPGVGMPTGTVQFQIDGTNSGNPVSVSTSGGVTTALLSTAGLSVGTHTIRANYSGDTNFASSNGTLSGGQTVNRASTSSAVISSLNPAYFGQSVTFTATVSVFAPGAGTPTGTVQFQIDGSNTGNPVSVTTIGGVTTASLSTTALTVATHSIAAIYNGDGNFATSTGNLTGGEVVKPNGVTAALSSNPGILVIISDPGNNAITIKTIAPGMLRVSGDPATPPATPTRVNGTDYADFGLSSITGISIQFLNGNDKVAMTGFNVSGDILISAGSGTDTFTLDTLTAGNISLTATGADMVSLSFVAARKDLMIAVGAGTQSVAVKNTSALDLILRAHSKVNDNIHFNLESDTITNPGTGGLTLDDSRGAGNDGVVLSYLNIASQLAVTLSGGVNYLDADHVTASFGFIDGGEPNSGVNVYTDNGGNFGFFVYDFVGH